MWSFHQNQKHRLIWLFLPNHFSTVRAQDLSEARYVLWVTTQKQDSLGAWVFYPILIHVMMSHNLCTPKITVFRDSLCGLCAWNCCRWVQAPLILLHHSLCIMPPPFFFLLAYISCFHQNPPYLSHLGCGYSPAQSSCLQFLTSPN